MAFNGSARNTNGQVRQKLLRASLCALLSRDGDDPLKDKPKNQAQKIAFRLINAYFEAETTSEVVKAFEAIRDTAEGKPMQEVESKIEINAEDAKQLNDTQLNAIASGEITDAEQS